MTKETTEPLVLNNNNTTSVLPSCILYFNNVFCIHFSGSIIQVGLLLGVFISPEYIHRLALACGNVVSKPTKTYPGCSRLADPSGRVCWQV